uniref:Putative secreted protein n=1 Tax=Ixodes ricinus TaxID=34613 RepID=A0A090X9I2_IXORI
MTVEASRNARFPLRLFFGLLVSLSVHGLLLAGSFKSFYVVLGFSVAVQLCLQQRSLRRRHVEQRAQQIHKLGHIVRIGHGFHNLYELLNIFLHGLLLRHVSQSHPCVPFCISYDVPKPGLWNLALCDRALSCLLVVCIELELEVMGGLEGTVLGKSSDHFDSCMKPVLGRHGCGLRLVE